LGRSWEPLLLPPWWLIASSSHCLDDLLGVGDPAVGQGGADPLAPQGPDPLPAGSQRRPCGADWFIATATVPPAPFGSRRCLSPAFQRGQPTITPTVLWLRV